MDKGVLGRVMCSSGCGGGSYSIESLVQRRFERSSVRQEVRDG